MHLGLHLERRGAKKTKKQLQIGHLEAPWFFVIVVVLCVCTEHAGCLFAGEQTVNKEEKERETERDIEREGSLHCCRVAAASQNMPW